MADHDLLVGRYQLRGLLGCGGMAEVHDGWDMRLDRAVAVKLLHPALSRQPDNRRRFEVEARAAARLSHPNIVSVHDYGDHHGRPFIVMERLPGSSLADLLARGPMAPEHVRAALVDVSAALDVAHAAGIVHRDIKPANILISSTGDSMKVADFGIAKTGEAVQTMTGQIVGTMSYMSPERLTGAPASVADDLYAVGVIGYEAVLGRRAFPQDTPAAVARAIVDDPPPPLADLLPDVDPVLAGVIDRAMAHDPARRFLSAGQMRAALAGDRHALLERAAPPRPATRVLSEPVPPSLHYVAARPPRRRVSRRARLGVAGAAVVAAIAVSVVALATDPSSSAPRPEPVGTSASVPTPTAVAPPPPQPNPVVQPPEKPVQKRGGGPDGGPGNGHKKHDNGKKE